MSKRVATLGAVPTVGFFRILEWVKGQFQEHTKKEIEAHKRVSPQG